jgi:queuine/archaeosine tRNA-ribosyltransferase
MVPLKTPEILSCLRRVREILRRGVQLHLLGVTRLDRVQEFAALGVVSFDSTSPLRQAFKDDKDNYYTPDRTYCAIRVPQVEGNAKMRGRIVAGTVNQAEARRLERACLEALERFDRGECDVPEVVPVLRDYERMHGGRSDRTETYAETLRDRPWKACPCEICRRLGIHVLLFRGAERNRRRGFHNLFVFYRRLHASCRGSISPPES